MSLLNLGVRHLPLRHWGHKGVVGYPYCGINPHGWATPYSGIVYVSNIKICVKSLGNVLTPKNKM